MARRGKLVFEEDREAARLLSKRLSGIISGLMEEAGETQKSIAPKIGMARPTLNVILNASDGKNLWRLPSLCAVARVLGIEVMDLFRALDAGENEDDDRGVELQQKVILATRAGSPERLRRLLWHARKLFVCFRGLSGRKPDEADLSGEELERYYGCTPLEIEQGCPEFWSDFTSLKLGNVDAVSAAIAAFDYVEDHGGQGNLPFWIGLKKTYRAK